MSFFIPSNTSASYQLCSLKHIFYNGYISPPPSTTPPPPLPRERIICNGLTGTMQWICNYILYFTWNVITQPCSNLSSGFVAVQVRGWMKNHIALFYEYVIIHSMWANLSVMMCNITINGTVLAGTEGSHWSTTRLKLDNQKRTSAKCNDENYQHVIRHGFSRSYDQ